MNKTAAFLFFTGFMVALGAVGGIENDAPLLDAVLVAVVGLGIMGCGALYGRRVDSPVV